jgi:ribosomal protein S18 acetylase RimI-like enzyme
MYDICVRTADAGGDARGQYASDNLMPDLFAGPYVHLEPELSFVLLTGHYHPEGRLEPELVDYPAHLHIDLLPDYQGKGFGRALINTWLAGANAAGAPAAFLNMDPANLRARRFYEKVGFREIAVSGGWGIYLGRPTK